MRAPEEGGMGVGRRTSTRGTVASATCGWREWVAGAAAGPGRLLGHSEVGVVFRRRNPQLAFPVAPVLYPGWRDGCGWRGRPRRPMTSCYFESLRETGQGDATDGLGWKHSFLIPWTSESVRGGRWRLRGIKRRPLLIGRLRQGNLNTKMSSRRLTSVVNYTDIELNPEGEECRRRTGGGGKVVEEEEEEKKKAESLENSVGCAGLLYTFIGI
ncbi:hypothetical protein CPB84DRAFT_370554 [Gymnopilus junonius]|uniref:Uncharacterized protein n=1 Tax=Gymnopilus junonius TaxID=109634 RepID=A0A9P5NA08_GYMJU|nr:hypothetical protein CPB84DRAFT_370554 [Gymnopilus junonius]